MFSLWRGVGVGAAKECRGIFQARHVRLDQGLECQPFLGGDAGVRASSWQFKRASSLCTARLTAACVTNSACAARLKLPCWQTAKKACSSGKEGELNFMPSFDHDLLQKVIGCDQNVV